MEGISHGATSNTLSTDAALTLLVVGVCVYMFNRNNNRNVINNNVDEAGPLSADTIVKSFISICKLPFAYAPGKKYKLLPCILPTLCYLSNLCFNAVLYYNSTTSNKTISAFWLSYDKISTLAATNNHLLKAESLASFFLHPLFISKNWYSQWLLFTSVQLFLYVSLLEFDVGKKRALSLITQGWCLQIIGNLMLVWWKRDLLVHGMDTFLFLLLTLLLLYNPKVDTRILDNPSYALPLPFEARWHALALAFVSYGVANPDVTTFRGYQLFHGVCSGVLLWMKDGRNSVQLYQHLTLNNVRRIFYCGLLFICELYLPFTMQPYHRGGLIKNGLDLRWWKANFSSSLSIMEASTVLGEGFLCHAVAKLVVFVCPVLMLLADVSVLNWIIPPIIMLHLMSAMNTVVWILPNIGFYSLLFLLYKLFMLTE